MRNRQQAGAPSSGYLWLIKTKDRILIKVILMNPILYSIEFFECPS